MKTSVQLHKTITLELSEEEAQHLLNIFNWGAALANLVKNHLPEHAFSGLAFEKDVVANGFNSLTESIVEGLVKEAKILPSYRRVL